MLKRRYSEPSGTEKIRVHPVSGYSTLQVGYASQLSIKDRLKDPNYVIPQIIPSVKSNYRDLPEPSVYLRSQLEATSPPSRNKTRRSPFSLPSNEEQNTSPTTIANVKLLFKRLESITNDNAALRKKISNFKTQRDSALQAKAKILTSLKQVRAEKKRQAEEMRTTKKEVMCLRNDNKNANQLRCLIERMQKELNDNEYKKDMLIENLRLANMEKQMQDSELKRLKTINENMNREKRLKEQLLEKVENRHCILERTTESLKKQLEEATAANKEKDDKDCLRRMEVELKSVIVDRIHLQSLTTKQKQEIKEMKDEIEKLQKAKNNLLMQKSELQDKLASMYLELNNFQDSVKKLEKDTVAYDSETAKGNDARQWLEKDSANLDAIAREMQIVVETQNTEIYNLKEEIQQTNNLLIEAQEANKNLLAEKITEIETLSEANKLQEREKSVLARKAEELQQLVQDNIKEVALLIEETTQNKTQLAKVESETDSVRRENERLKNTVKCFEIYKSNLVRDYEEARDKVDLLEKEKLSIQIQNTSLSKEKAALKENVDAKEVELRHLRQEIHVEKQKLNKGWWLLKKEKESLAASLCQLNEAFHLTYNASHMQSLATNNKSMFGDPRNVEAHSQFTCMNSSMIPLLQKPNLRLKMSLPYGQDSVRTLKVSCVEVSIQTDPNQNELEKDEKMDQLERRLKQIEINYSEVMDKNYVLQKENREGTQALNALQCKHKALNDDHQKLKADLRQREKDYHKLNHDYWNLRDELESVKKAEWRRDIREDKKIIHKNLSTFKRSFRNRKYSFNRT